MLIVGHRGARGEAPENTLGGFQYALERGVRHFELDLRLSADGVPMVIHDASCQRTCESGELVANSTAEQLSMLDASRAHPWHQREPVPSLALLLPVLDQANSVQLEIKRDHPRRLLLLIQATRKLLAGHNSCQYTLTSFDRRALELAAKLAPEIPRGLVTDRRFTDVIAQARRLECSLLVYHYPIVSPIRLDKARDAGLSMSCYTVNDSAHIKKLRQWGIDSAITDHPVRYLHLQG